MVGARRDEVCPAEGGQEVVERVLVRHVDDAEANAKLRSPGVEQVVRSDSESNAAPVAELDPKAKAALDDLAQKLKDEGPKESEKLAKAADERKRSRVQKFKPRTYRWEPPSGSSANYVLVVALVVTLAAVFVVAFTVFLR